MKPRNICLFSTFTCLAILCVIIGLPIFLSGCNDEHSVCIDYNIKDAIVYNNKCTKYNGENDDDIAYNCNVKLMYSIKGVNQTCTLHRSDSDYCNPPVSHWSDLKRCENLNKMDYPMYSHHDMYIKNHKCYSHHYVHNLYVIGLSFLLIGMFFLVLVVIIWLTDNKYLNFLISKRNNEVSHIILNSVPNPASYEKI